MCMTEAVLSDGGIAARVFAEIREKYVECDTLMNVTLCSRIQRYSAGALVTHVDPHILL